MINLHSILCKVNANIVINYLCCLNPNTTFGSSIDYIYIAVYVRKLYTCTCMYVHIYTDYKIKWQISKEPRHTDTETNSATASVLTS